MSEADVIDWLNANMISSPAGACLHCRGTNEPLLPFGITSAHVWLHLECWPAWTAGRRAEAEKAISELLIGKSDHSVTAS